MPRMEEIDRIYLSICERYSQLSRCLSRRVGALLVNPDGVVIGLGVNGPPRGVPHCNEVPLCPQCHISVRNERCPVCSSPGELAQECPRNREVKGSLAECPAVHAEVNAILACGTTNNSTRGCTLYVWPLGPCKDCASIIVQAGIKEVVYPESEPYDDMGPWILHHGKVQIRRI